MDDAADSSEIHARNRRKRSATSSDDEKQDSDNPLLLGLKEAAAAAQDAGKGGGDLDLAPKKRIPPAKPVTDSELVKDGGKSQMLSVKFSFSVSGPHICRNCIVYCQNFPPAALAAGKSKGNLGQGSQRRPQK